MASLHVIMLSHCHCERKSARDSMRFLWLQSARWLGFPGGTLHRSTPSDNFDIPCGSGGRLKCLPQGASDVVTPLSAITDVLCCPATCIKYYNHNDVDDYATVKC